MKVLNISELELNEAMQRLNDIYDNNVEFNNYQRLGQTSFRVTLRVKDSHGKGAKLGHPNLRTGRQRHTISACWHVHGNFFEKLFEVNPNAIVKTARKTITKENGNWEDWNIGSMMYPLYYSEACECEGMA